MRIFNPFPHGKHCFVVPYEGKALKIFNFEMVDDWKKDISWGDRPSPGQPNMSVPLEDSIIIQNICAMHGLAPRVYEKVGVCLGMKKHFAVITDMVKGESSIEQTEKVYNEVKKLGETYGFKNDKDDYSAQDAIDGKLVDFNTFHFTRDYKDKIKKQYVEAARYGKIYYHDVPELGLTNSPRDNDQRIKWLGLDRIDFTKQSMTDYGCAGGFFCRYAKSRGAGDVLGIDYPGVGSDNPIKAAELMSNYLKHWNIDYMNQDLSEECNRWPADITLFLSMNYHIGIPKWLPEVTIDLCVFEDNSKNRDALATLKQMFNKVEMVGRGKDHGDKPIYWCWK